MRFRKDRFTLGLIGKGYTSRREQRPENAVWIAAAAAVYAHQE